MTRTAGEELDGLLPVPRAEIEVLNGEGVVPVSAIDRPRGPLLAKCAAIDLLHGDGADKNLEIDPGRGPLSDERAGIELLVGEGVVPVPGVAGARGPFPDGGAEGVPGPLRPIQAHEIAKKYAVKMFFADLLAEWKRIARAESTGEVALDAGLGGYIDRETAILRGCGAVWDDIQRTRRAQQLRKADSIAEAMKLVEKKAHQEVTQALRKHPLWSWLLQYPGLRGAHTAYVIGVIRHPLRFPGQRCEAGHYAPAVYPVGYPCDAWSWVDGKQVPCGALLGPERRGTGARSLWHYLGLHVGDDGRSPRKRKGQRTTWDPRARASVLQPDGIADQIVRSKVPVYRDIYDAKKASLIEQRGLIEPGHESGYADGGAELPREREHVHGPADHRPESESIHGGADEVREIETWGGPAEVELEIVPSAGGAT